MDFIRDNIRNMAAYTPGAQPRDLSKVVKLNTNENPYPPSPKVAEAIEDWLQHGRSLRYYPDPTCTQIRERVAEIYNLAPENVLVGNGSDEILRLAMHATAGPGRPAAWPIPTYSLYPVLARMFDAPIQEYGFEEEGVLPARLKECDARVVYIANPNPPRGTVLPLDQLDELCNSNQRLVVSDEAYADFCDVTAIPLIAKRHNILVSRTLSKSFALAGDRLGLGLGDAELIGALNKIRDSYNVSTLAQVAALGALSDVEYYEEGWQRIRATREKVRDELVRLGAEVPVSGGNFLFARFASISGEAIYNALEAKGILVRHFRDPALADSVRISIGTEEQMERVLEELSVILKQGTGTHG